MSIETFSSWVNLARVQENRPISEAEELVVCNPEIARERVQDFLAQGVPIFDIAKGAKIVRRYTELKRNSEEYYEPYFDRVATPEETLSLDRALRLDSGVNAGILGALSVREAEIEAAMTGGVFRCEALAAEAQIVPVTIQNIPNIAYRTLGARLQDDLSQLIIISSPSAGQ